MQVFTWCQCRLLWIFVCYHIYILNLSKNFFGVHSIPFEIWNSFILIDQQIRNVQSTATFVLILVKWCFVSISLMIFSSVWVPRQSSLIIFSDTNQNQSCPLNLNLLKTEKKEADSSGTVRALKSLTDPLASPVQRRYDGFKLRSYTIQRSVFCVTFNNRQLVGS